MTCIPRVAEVCTSSSGTCNVSVSLWSMSTHKIGNDLSNEGALSSATLQRQDTNLAAAAAVAASVKIVEVIAYLMLSMLAPVAQEGEDRDGGD